MRVAFTVCCWTEIGVSWEQLSDCLVEDYSQSLLFVHRVLEEKVKSEGCQHLYPRNLILIDSDISHRERTKQNKKASQTTSLVNFLSPLLKVLY